MHPFSPPSPLDAHAQPSRVGRASRRAATALAVGLTFVVLAGCGSSSPSSGPPGGTDPSRDTSFAQITAGQEFFLALDDDGQAWGWGYNGDEQLGDGTTTNHTVPTRVSMPSGTTFERISAAATHSVALDAGGSAWGWGSNFAGQLGLDSSTDHFGAPTRVVMPNGVRFVDVSAGLLYTLAVDESGQAWGWGHNKFGKLGDGTTEDRRAPVEIVMPDGVAFSRIATGMFRSFALDTDGRPWGWGDNTGGALGDGTAVERHVPVELDLPAGVTLIRIATASGHTVALDQQGRVWEWGLTSQSDPDGTAALVPTAAGRTFTDVAAGYGFSLALDQDGQIWSWGDDNYYGQFGDGTTDDRATVDLIDMPDGVRFTSVAAEFYSGAAIDDAGTVWTWGRNYYGELGDGGTGHRSSPAPVVMP